MNFSSSHMPSPSHFPSSNHLIGSIWQITKLLQSFIMQFSPVFITSCLLCPNIFFSSLFSKTLSHCSSLSVRDQVLNQIKQCKKITILYILIFLFLDSIHSFIYCTSVLLHMQHWTRPNIYYKIITHVQSLKTVTVIKVGDKRFWIEW
jgi:hypothetical protein